MNSQLWANSAIDSELSTLAKMPEGTNVNKPGNPIFVSMLKIASIVRGGYVPEHEALNSVKKSLCTFAHIPQEEIDYQWKRVMRIAKPRHPKEQNRLPKQTRKTVTETQWQIREYDLTTYKMRVLREVSPKTAVKARDMAEQIKTYVLYGEIAKKSNMTIYTVNIWHGTGKVDLLLTFPRYTLALADCVTVACAMLHGGMSDDFENGKFDVIIPLNFDMENRPKVTKNSKKHDPPYMGGYSVYGDSV